MSEDLEGAILALDGESSGVFVAIATTLIGVYLACEGERRSAVEGVLAQWWDKENKLDVMIGLLVTRGDGAGAH